MTILTTEEIVKRARQAGLDDEVLVPWSFEMQAFAKLVAEAAASKEREVCAKVCEELVIEVVGNSALAVDQCVRAIRARGINE